MNFLRQSGLCTALVMLSCGIACKPPTETKVKLDKHRLEYQKAYPQRPLAQSERMNYYEGEDIWVSVILPVTDDPLYSGKRAYPITGAVRLFSGGREVDSIDAWTVMKPGDSLRKMLNEHRLLPVGKYRGFLDTGVESKEFRFRVIPLPDSLRRIWTMQLSMARTRPRSESRFKEPPERESYVDSTREFARQLLAFPQGTPLRQEGLRQILNSHVLRAEDSLLYRDIVIEYVSEPRNQPDLAAEYLQGLCYWDYESDCWEQLARQWGDQRVIDAVKKWRQRLQGYNLRLNPY